jgi:hypothetical protein
MSLRTRKIPGDITVFPATALIAVITVLYVVLYIQNPDIVRQFSTNCELHSLSAVDS